MPRTVNYYRVAMSRLQNRNIVVSLEYATHKLFYRQKMVFYTKLLYCLISFLKLTCGHSVHVITNKLFILNICTYLSSFLCIVVPLNGIITFKCMHTYLHVIPTKLQIQNKKFLQMYDI